MNTDLTVGKAEQVLWKFCIPLFGSIIFQQLYNLADSWVAGKFIGEQALAAVGNSYEITLIFLAFAFGCNIGCSVVWREELPRHENGCVNRHDRQRCPVRRVDGLWHCQRRHAAAADSHAPGDLIRFEAVPGHLHLGSALSAVLQHRHGDFFRPG